MEFDDESLIYDHVISTSPSVSVDNWQILFQKKREDG